MASRPKVKHLYSTDPRPSALWHTECGLSTQKASAVRTESRCTCEDCPRIRRERHEIRMQDAAYRRFHETVAAFAALGIRAGRHGAISLTATEAAKVLRLLKRAHRKETP